MKRFVSTPTIAVCVCICVSKQGGEGGGVGGEQEDIDALLVRLAAVEKKRVVLPHP